MRVAILYEMRTDDVTSSAFMDVLQVYKAMGADIKILCVGFEGRVGDKYDILRSRNDVIFTEGLPERLWIQNSSDWRPDVTMRAPTNIDTLLRTMI